MRTRSQESGQPVFASPQDVELMAPRAGRAMLIVILLGQMMAALDTSIVNVAVPAIRQGLRASGAELQLIVSSYIIAYAVLLITGSRLGKDHGHAHVYVWGVSLFTVSSIVCGLAPNAAVLVGARVAQGVGAALTVPQVLSMIQLHFTGATRSRALASYSLVLGAGVAVGQVLGGALVTANLFGSAWRPIFLVNAPLGLAVVLFGRRYLPAEEPTVRQRMDGWGVTLLSTSVIVAVVPLTFGDQAGWPWWSTPALLAGIAGLGVFLWYEARLAASGGAPLLAPDVLRAPGVIGGLCVIFLLYVCYGGLLFTTALHLQGGLGYSPARSGLTFATYAVGFATVNLLWSRLPRTWHRWVAPCALGMVTLADVAVATQISSVGWSGVATGLLLLAGAGHGAAFGALVDRLVSLVAARDAASLSGMMTTVIQLAIVVGVAALGSLYLSAYHPHTRVSSEHALGTVYFVAAALALAGVPIAARVGVVRAPSSP